MISSHLGLAAPPEVAVAAPPLPGPSLSAATTRHRGATRLARPAAASLVPVPQGIFCQRCAGCRAEIQVPPKFRAPAAEAAEEAGVDAGDSRGLVLGSGLPMQILDGFMTSLEGLRPASSKDIPLEKALDALAGPSVASSSSAPLLARRGAAARQAMRKALRRRPEHFAALFRNALAELFPTDAEPGRSSRARDFLERRSLYREIVGRRGIPFGSWQVPSTRLPFHQRRRRREPGWLC